ncbi:hypothetical protein GH714_032215 [Hevea brasiliensis]|uniref:glucan endo-1,3-beta-D-glucosidase n=1 Tax=Hevea brasiliensis TaxID=3981 RepID=A0A6A6MIW3_HEVBR|nr:hypothetical protein GH714_032215 [Hevea brasiliensis]
MIRIAILPDSDPKYEAILDRFSSCYAVSGDAALTKPFCLEYKWEKKGWGDLLMLAHPLHTKLLSGENVIILNDFKYRSIDGDLVGVVGDSWMLKTDPISDVEGLNASAITTTSSYFYGKLVARAARLALIAEEVGFLDVIPVISKYLKETIEPWLEGTFGANGFLLLSLCIAVLAKFDPLWGRKYRPQAYALMADFMNLGRRSNSNYPRLRCFDLYKLHSWAGGLTEFADGRNQESTSEAVNAYYSAALMGLAYGDTHLVATGSCLLPWRFMQHKHGGMLKRVIICMKRISLERIGCEVLFSDVGFIRELVNWTLPALGREGVGEGWKGFVYALEAIYDKQSALEKIRNLNGHDDVNFYMNMEDEMEISIP